MRFKDLTGQTFGYLTVIERVYDPSYTRAHWRCKCKCGNETIVPTYRLNSGDTTSCGCKRYESRNQTHGLRHTRIYSIWCGMKARCHRKTDKLYKRYGAKGITVCDDWKDNFLAFYNWSMDNGYTDELTIDRIDNSKGYSPDNCRWITHAEQQRNKSNVPIIEYCGKQVTMIELSEMTGVSIHSIRNRRVCALKRNGSFTVDDLLTDHRHSPVYTEKFYNRKQPGRRLIGMYSKDGKLLKKMYLRDVKQLGFSRTAVGNCLAGRAKSSGGYIWKYADE